MEEPPLLVTQVIASIYTNSAWLTSFLELEEVKEHVQLESSENVLGK